MAFPLANTAEGGTNTTAVTNANSGGASGNAWDVIDANSNGSSITFDNTHAAHGGLSYKFVQGTVAATHRVRWSTSPGTFTECWGRVYLYQTAFGTSASQVVRINDSAQTRLAVIHPGIASDQHLYVQASIPGTQDGGSVVMALNQWVRIEWHFICNDTTGLIEAKLFNTADSVTADDTVIVQNVDTNGNGSGAQVEFGHGVGVNANEIRWLDDMQVNGVGYPGPAVAGQVVLPDADLAAGGWTTSPLFSKVNDVSDATIITGTAA